MRGRHCERSEAIQESFRGGILDCFAVLAMTVLARLRSIGEAASARQARGDHVLIQVFCPTPQAA
jgi:hypothetical protein